MENRVDYHEMVDVFVSILEKKGFSKETAQISGELFAQNSLDGVYTHGVNRFPRVIDYIEKGYIDPNAMPKIKNKIGSLEQWDGSLAMGNSNAKLAMDRAIDISEENGVGIVAMSNTNHWMRGGAYGWQAADRGKIGICWTNTMPNMPAWGTIGNNIGNNPFILSVPRENGKHIVIDCAMAQFSYGKLEEYRLNDKELPIYGGYNSDLELTKNPGEIEESKLVLPIGFWKGSGLSIVLDLIVAILSNGNSVTDIGEKCEDEYGLSQIFIAIDPNKVIGNEGKERIIDNVLKSINDSEQFNKGVKAFYPGELEYSIRQENLKNGIPVVPEIWSRIKEELNK